MITVTVAGRVPEPLSYLDQLAHDANRRALDRFRAQLIAAGIAYEEDEFTLDGAVPQVEPEAEAEPLAEPLIDDLVENDSFTAPIVFDMTYRSGAKVTARRIKLISIRPEPHEVYFNAFCFMRESYRLFKVSSIVEVTDMVTGEVFSDGRAYFEDLGILKPLCAEDRALRACAHDLTVLAYLAACDGSFAACEHDAIVKHVALSVDEPLDEAVIARRIGFIAPDPKAFRAALRKLDGDEARRRALVRAIRNVIDADGHAHEHEILVGGEILKALGHTLT